VVNDLWHFLYEIFPDYQFALVDSQYGDLMVIGNCIPIVWDGNPLTLPSRGIDGVLETGVAAARAGTKPTAASALMIVIEPSQRGRRLSADCVKVMGGVVADHGLDTLVAPVRPTAKHRYPLIPMERYVRWRRADGSLFDPWLRVHERVGATGVGVAPAAMTVRGTVAEWEAWTRMAMPETGSYVVRDALVPLAVDREHDEGLYVEPAFWMYHRIPTIR
jgi:hypothetical protein